MNANPEMPAPPDPLSLLTPAPPGAGPVGAPRHGVGEVIETVLYYSLLAVGVGIPVLGGLYAVLYR